MPFACHFETGFGMCGIVWGEQGIMALSLPEKSEAHLKRKLGLVAKPGLLVYESPSPSVSAVINRIQAYFQGSGDPFQNIDLDQTQLTDFPKRVYRELRAVGPGQTLSYGELARRSGV